MDPDTKGHRAGPWSHGGSPQAPGNPERCGKEVGRAMLGPGHSLALQPAKGPSSYSPYPYPNHRGCPARPSHSLFPRAQVPPPFFFLMVPKLFYPMAGCGKNAVSSERGPRVTGGGNPHSMAPGVKDPPLSLRLHCPRPCLRLCPPGPIPYNHPRIAPEQRLQSAGHHVAPLCPGTPLLPVVWPWPSLSKTGEEGEGI